MNQITETSWSFFFRYLYHRKYIYIIGLFALMMTAIAQTIQPRLIGYAIDQLKQSKPLPFFDYGSAQTNFFFILVIYLLLHFILFIGRFLWRRFLARETHYASDYMRMRIWQRILLLKNEDLKSSHTPGVMMSLSASDVFTARFLFGFILVGTFDLFFLGIFAIYGMLLIDVQITLFTLAMLPPVTFISLRLSKLETIAFTESKEELSHFNDKVSQIINTLKLQRLNGDVSFWQDLLFKSAMEFRNKKLRALVVSLYFYPLLGSVIFISYFILFYFSLMKLQSGALSIGEFIGLQGLIVVLQHPILELGFIISEWQMAKASLQRVVNFLNHPIDTNLLAVDHLQPDPQAAIFEVNKLSFNYLGNISVFKNFSLKVNKGERLGITGGIGSGKSTLLKILSGLEQNFSGDILLKGRDIKLYSREQLAQEVCYLSQENFLFADSIRANIALDKEMTDDEIWHYLHIACVAEDIREFSDGLDTELGEWGVNLSGGQKQRVCLARALARHPDVLLLDDCLSAVDGATEKIILENLDRELTAVTLVWVAHRESTLQKCNRIISLDE